MRPESEDDRSFRDKPEGGENGGGKGWTVPPAVVRTLQLLLTVAVTWFILDRVGVSLDEVRALELEQWRPDWFLLVLSSLLLLAGYFVSAVLWGVMVAELGGPRIPALVSCRIYFVSNLARYVPGKVWQLASLSYLARREGIPIPVATGAAILGHGMALGGAALVGAGALFQGGERFRLLGVIALLGITLPLLVVTIPPLFRRVLALGFRLLRQPRPEELQVDAWFGVRWLALYAVNWAVYSIAFWILVRSFQLAGGPFEVASAFAAAYLLGYVAVFAPAGLGVREGFLIALLQPVHGVAALGLAVIARLWTVLIEVIPAFFFAGGSMARKNRMEGKRAP